MILFNITLLSDQDIHEELKSWILTDFFPKNSLDDVLSSQALLKVINSPNEGVTYAMQFIAESEDAITKFRQQHLPSLHAKVQQNWTNKVFFFESVMEYQ